MPKDVLALGRHLVDELGEERGDTLSWWMAHHVAELIDKARSHPPGPERIRSERLATETILKIWDHRESLPHYAYPLTRYKELLRILDVLQPDENPYRFSRLSRTDHLAAMLFDRLSRLVILVLLLHTSDAKGKRPSRALVSALDDEEKQVLKRLNDWAKVLPLKPERPRKQTRSSNDKAKPQQLDVKGIRKSIIHFLDDSTKALADLRSEIINESPKQNG